MGVGHMEWHVPIGIFERLRWEQIGRSAPWKARNMSEALRLVRIRQGQTKCANKSIWPDLICFTLGVVRLGCYPLFAFVCGYVVQTSYAEKKKHR